MAEQTEQGGWHPGRNPWLIAMTVTIATFMEVMDTSIANVALPHIAGGLSVSPDEATWVLTSYLVSNAIVLPTSAWLSDRFGRKRFYMTCVALFSVSSFLCGIAPNLTLLIVFRILQGMGGGGLAPSEQAILADTFPPQQRGSAFALYGMGVVLAPAIGPTLGGWITDTYNWRWIFFINVPVGVLSLLLTNIMVVDPPHIQKAVEKAKGNPVDFLGLALLAMGLGSMQVVLDKGQRDDWFNSHSIAVFTVLAVFGIAAFVIRELHHKHPIVELHYFKNRNFTISNLLRLTIWGALLGTTVLIPLFAETQLGYTAEKAGELLTPGAVGIFLLLPVIGYLSDHVEARYLIAIGTEALTIALLRMANLVPNVDFSTLMWWRVEQSMALAFLFVPINVMAYSDMPREASNQVSAMISLMRNLGGSIGISMFTTLLARREQAHQDVLARNTYRYNPQFQQLLAALRAHFGQRTGQVEAMQQAYAQIYAQMQRQATVLAYIDTIWFMAAICVVALVIMFFAKRTPIGRAGGAH